MSQELGALGGSLSSRQKLTTKTSGVCDGGAMPVANEEPPRMSYLDDTFESASASWAESSSAVPAPRPTASGVAVRVSRLVGYATTPEQGVLLEVLGRSTASADEALSALQEAASAGGFDGFVSNVSANGMARRQLERVLIDAELIWVDTPERSAGRGTMTEPPKPSYLYLRNGAESLRGLVQPRNEELAQSYVDAYSAFAERYVDEVRSADSAQELWSLGYAEPPSAETPRTYDRAEVGRGPSLGEERLGDILDGLPKMLTIRSAVTRQETIVRGGVALGETNVFAGAGGRDDRFVLNQASETVISTQDILGQLSDELPGVLREIDLPVPVHVSVERDGTVRANASLVGLVGSLPWVGEQLAEQVGDASIEVSGNLLAGEIGLRASAALGTALGGGQVQIGVAHKLVATPSLNRGNFFDLSEEQVRALDRSLVLGEAR